MQYLNINVSVFQTEPFLEAEDAQKAAWIQLMGYCAMAENGGVIQGARAWSETKCLIMLRVPKAVLVSAAGLWRWKDNDLVVEFYPKEQEKALRSKRSGCREAARARWKGAPHASAHASASPDADAPAHASAHASASPDADAPADAERKGRESKGTVRIGEASSINDAESLVRLWPKQRGVDDAKLCLLAAFEEKHDPAVIRARTLAIVAALRAARPPGGAETNRFVEGADAFFGRKGWLDEPAAYVAQWAPRSQAGSQQRGMASAFAAEGRTVRLPRINGLPAQQTPATATP